LAATICGGVATLLATLLGAPDGFDEEGLEGEEDCGLEPPCVELPLRLGLRPCERCGRGNVTCGDCPGDSPCAWPGCGAVVLCELLVWVEELVSEKEALEDVLDDDVLVGASSVAALELLVLVLDVEDPVLDEDAPPPPVLAGGVMRGSPAPALAASGPPSPAAVMPPPASSDSTARRSQRRGAPAGWCPESSLIAASSIFSVRRPPTISGKPAAMMQLRSQPGSAKAAISAPARERHRAALGARERWAVAVVHVLGSG
jgi:hypothetical protein